MPGRGTPWRGVGRGTQDRIGTGEILDSSISEVDLDSALQAKVNAVGGSGNVEKILDASVSSNLILQTFNFDRSVAMDGTDVGLVQVIISNIVLSASDIIEVQFNGESFSGTNTIGISGNGTNVTSVNETTITDGITTGTSDGLSIIIEVPGHLSNNGNQTGIFGRWADKNHFSSGSVDLQTNAFGSLVSIQIRTRGGSNTINTGTKVVAYAINKD